MELKPELLLRAYSIGIFPMAESRGDSEIHWIDPDRRGVLPIESFHIPRKLKRLVRQQPYEVRCDSAFGQVIRLCATPGPGRSDTWINPTIERLYCELHEIGFAHSVECWQDKQLVGGLYGVALGAAFFGESMFSRAPNASKIALVHLVARLARGEFNLLDTQFETPHLRQFGVVEITREAHRTKLSRAVRLIANFQGELSGSELERFLQSITQTS